MVLKTCCKAPHSPDKIKSTVWELLSDGIEPVNIIIDGYNESLIIINEIIISITMDTYL